MRIDVEHLTEAGQAFAHRYAPGELSLEDEYVHLKDDAVVEGRASLKNEEVRLRGRIHAQVEASCDRCLRPVGVPVDAEFDTVYVPQASEANITENVELQADDLRTAVYEGEAIEVDDLVREQILLALPTRLLCGEECKGLCPRCGADLNSQACSCEQHEVDPRWAALAALKKEEG